MTTGEQRQTGPEGSDEVRHQDAWTRGILARPGPHDFPVDDSASDEQGGFDVTTMLQLSLFLMLLTFFLALSASTSFDDRRVGSVIGGIQSAFGMLRGGQSDVSDKGNGSALPVLHLGARPATGAYASDIEAAFASVGAESSADGAVSFDMVVEASRLFVGGTAAMRAERRPLFEEISLLLSTSDGRRHLALLVPASPAQRLDVRRAASLARVLLADGAPPTQIAVGVQESADALVTFRFYNLPGSGK